MNSRVCIDSNLPTWAAGAYPPGANARALPVRWQQTWSTLNAAVLLAVEATANSPHVKVRLSH